MVIERSIHGIDSVKRKDASVVKKGQDKAVPQKHWAMDVTESIFPRGYDDDAAGAFLPRPGKDRATPHKKINECDH
jgi:hypothetical protein